MCLLPLSDPRYHRGKGCLMLSQLNFSSSQHASYIFSKYFLNKREVCTQYHYLFFGGGTLPLETLPLMTSPVTSLTRCTALYPIPQPLQQGLHGAAAHPRVTPDLQGYQPREALKGFEA